MTLTLNLPPETEARLAVAASKENLPVSDYVAHLVEEAIQEEALPEIKTGADLLAYWEKIGFVGMWADREDMGDSTEWVNQQQQKRKQAIREKLGLGQERK